MRRLAIALACALGACTTQAPTTATSPDGTGKLALAQRLADLHVPPEVVEIYGRSYVDEYIARMPSQDEACEMSINLGRCEVLFKRYMADVAKIMNASITSIMSIRSRMVDETATIYADVYTLEELDALLTFAESPVGSQTLAKFPEVARRQAAGDYEIMRPWTEAIYQLQEDLADSYRDDFAALF